MNKWDSRMLALAKLVATWSKDPSTGVGAVIVDSKHRIVSVGFNGFPRGVSDSDKTLLDREEKLRRTIHAEENALLFASRPVEGCIIYVTHPPCARCAAKLIQAGIVRVVASTPANTFTDRWGEDLCSAADMFKEAGVSAFLAKPTCEEPV
jgi:dCMP deaminase